MEEEEEVVDGAVAKDDQRLPKSKHERDGEWCTYHWPGMGRGS